jgi:MYXO-CTERM domain-containing protein
MKRRIAAAAALLVATLVSRADAGVVIDINQVGSDVVATGSGTLDLTGLTFEGSGTENTGLNAQASAIILGPPAGAPADDYFGATGPTQFGPGSSTFQPTSGSGDLFGPIIGHIEVPQGYKSGAHLSATDTYANQTIAGLGLAPGTYVYTWGTGAHSDSLTINVSVPEPSSLVMAGAAMLAGLGMRARRRPTTAIA